MQAANEEERARFPLFSDLSPEAFLAVTERLEPLELPSGELLFQEGDPGDSRYLISSGRMEVLKSDDSG